MAYLTKQQKDIKRAAREFAKKEFDSFIEDCDKNEAYPDNLFKKACELGFIGVFIDETYDGGGLGLFDQILILEEFWRVDPGCGNIVLSSLGSEILQKFADEDHKRTILPQIADGKITIGVTGDHRALKNGVTYKKNQENYYVLNGYCSFVLNGNIFDKLLVFASEDVEENEHPKLSVFLLGKGQKGLSISKMEDKLGVRATDIAHLRLEAVQLDKTCIIGEEGKGGNQIDFYTDILCLYTCAQAIGLTQACLDLSKKYSSQRVQFGKPINYFQLVKYKLSEMVSKLELCKSVCYTTAQEMQNGSYDKKMPLILSLFAKEMAVIAASETLQIHGGFGYIKETGIERLYRDAQFLNCFGISQDSAKLKLAEMS